MYNTIVVIKAFNRKFIEEYGKRGDRRNLQLEYLYTYVPVNISSINKEDISADRIGNSHFVEVTIKQGRNKNTFVIHRRLDQDTCSIPESLIDMLDSNGNNCILDLSRLHPIFHYELRKLYTTINKIDFSKVSNLRLDVICSNICLHTDDFKKVNYTLVLPIVNSPYHFCTQVLSTILGRLYASKDGDKKIKAFIDSFSKHSKYSKYVTFLKDYYYVNISGDYVNSYMKLTGGGNSSPLHMFNTLYSGKPRTDFIDDLAVKIARAEGYVSCRLETVYCEKNLPVKNTMLSKKKYVPIVANIEGGDNNLIRHQDELVYYILKVPANIYKDKDKFVKRLREIVKHVPKLEYLEQLEYLEPKVVNDNINHYNKLVYMCETILKNIEE